MDKIIGFIGSGNMGGAIIGGILSSGLVGSGRIMASDPSERARKTLRDKYGVIVTADNTAVSRSADILFLAVKPHIIPAVCEEIEGKIKDGSIVVTIAAGQTLANMAKMLGKSQRVVRAMPNTPALVGEGMSALCPGKGVSPGELEQVEEIFRSFGKCEVVTENLFDAVVGVSGSSPAYVFMFIEALADAGVAEGMPRDKAYTFAAQSVLGSARMVLETGLHPGELKDMVCSPGGTTIQAVMELERKGMRGAVMSAAEACISKSREMSR